MGEAEVWWFVLELTISEPWQGYVGGGDPTVEVRWQGVRMVRVLKSDGQKERI